MEPLGVVLKRARGRAGMSQVELARGANVTRSWLSRVEAGDIEKPDYDMLEQVEAALVGVVPHGSLRAAAGYGVTPAAPKRRDLEGVLREALAIVEELKRRGISLDDEDVPHGGRLSRAAAAYSNY